uniref:Uncharacterized protein n=1 Tax=Fibrocapsa japonica TaxID=94617 RepID=A0A7S2V2K7_9STRA|mmetsp:Transcript_21661/g.31428  ORF Transcript_21661/g.31428 Transcript_21661/m.31428 type:complete len:391 (+) Transcript_21661:173-1345(+)|eukprot:CAMPEP_0113933666 /NCGR_PEP_ID=MMETSP1339-20121228/914_1 /TAXON_ID=94617 /ORGANISM="Fibrocapsa japonica" /LENGTH=390 /DNA_ID=CAMNT_0000935069 /DNA_START=157 /DNA_END=1329 /DNA_ORIENTATION=+ /assembly_acc=CAM_ASM_000762
MGKKIFLLLYLSVLLGWKGWEIESFSIGKPIYAKTISREKIETNTHRNTHLDLSAATAGGAEYSQQAVLSVNSADALTKKFSGLFSFRQTSNILDNVVTPFSPLSVSSGLIQSESRAAVKAAVKPRRPFCAKFANWIGKRIIKSRSRYVSKLSVSVASDSNIQVLSGNLKSIEVSFDQLFFEKWQVTGGGYLQILGLNLKLTAFVFTWLRKLKKPFELYSEVVLTQSDLINSPALRDVAQVILNGVLSRALDRSLLSVKVRKVSIVDNRIAFYGIANSAVTGSIPFTVWTGLQLKDNGHVISLDQLEVSTNPNTWLEMTVPVYSLGPIDIDLGENAKIERLTIENRKVLVGARAVISTVPPFQVAQVEKRATYHYDLGKFLSTWGNFDKM